MCASGRPAADLVGEPGGRPRPGRLKRTAGLEPRQDVRTLLAVLLVRQETRGSGARQVQ
jgi:hypothetical protein